MLVQYSPRQHGQLDVPVFGHNSIWMSYYNVHYVHSAVAVLPSLYTHWVVHRQVHSTKNKHTEGTLRVFRVASNIHRMNAQHVQGLRLPHGRACWHQVTMRDDVRKQHRGTAYQHCKPNCTGIIGLSGANPTSSISTRTPSDGSMLVRTAAPHCSDHAHAGGCGVRGCV